MKQHVKCIGEGCPNSGRYRLPPNCQPSFPLSKTNLKEPRLCVNHKRLLNDENDVVNEWIIEEDINLKQKESYECMKNYPLAISNGENTSTKLHQAKRYTCNICNKAFEHFYQLRRHKYHGIHKLDVLKRNQKMIFQIIELQSQDNQMPSLSSSLIQKPIHYDFDCDLCCKPFNDILSLDEHIQCHNNTKGQLKCELCDEFYTNLEILKNHVIAHLFNRPFKCKMCEMSFSSLVSLSNHSKNHFDLNNKKFICIICHEIFLSKDWLSSHWYKHTSIKPYKCEECGCAFIHLITLQRHNEIAHF